MIKIEDIITPSTIEEFRNNLKKYCLGNDNKLFIYSNTIDVINKKRIENKIKFNVDINKVTKVSDILLQCSEEGYETLDYYIVLMFDFSHIDVYNFMIRNQNAIQSLKEVNVFNNQDKEERKNFLNSTSFAIEKITSGEKIINEKDARPKYTRINELKLTNLFYHIFGNFFDLVIGEKNNIKLSKYH